METRKKAMITAVLLIAILLGWVAIAWLNARSSSPAPIPNPRSNQTVSNLPMMAGSNTVGAAPVMPKTNSPQNSVLKQPVKRPVFYGK